MGPTGGPRDPADDEAVSDALDDMGAESAADDGLEGAGNSFNSPSDCFVWRPFKNCELLVSCPTCAPVTVLPTLTAR